MIEAEDRYIGATVKYFDIPLSLALNYLYYSLEIAVVDSRIAISLYRYWSFKFTH